MEKYEEIEWIELKEDEEDCFLHNMFTNPNPYQLFLHKFNILNNEITIELNGRKADEGQLLTSTGLTLWRAAPLLCNFLLINSNLYVNNKTILELGAGLGLCGILTAIIGASKVILSDGDSLSLSNMRENVERNKHLFSSNYNHDNDNNDNQIIECLQLRWGINVEEFKIKCNLSTPDGLFETIIGSDIIYVETILEPLFLTVSTLLTQNGAFLLAYARRNVKIDYVFETATKYGFQWIEPTSDEGCYIFTKIQ